MANARSASCRRHDRYPGVPCVHPGCTENRQSELCAVADRLLDELCVELQDIEWKRFCILSDEESFASRTQFVRLQFPLADIWNLPVAAHELGHFLADNLKSVDKAGGKHREFPESLAQRNIETNSRAWYQMNEYFADVFATFSLGPAYAYTCLLLRFSAVSAWRELDNQHPPEGLRAEAILRTLGRMNEEEDSNGPLAGVRNCLRSFWTNCLTASGTPVQGPSLDEVEKLTKEMYDMLKRGARHLRYKTFNRAEQQAENLFSSANSAQMGSMADLLNAAWLRRLTPGVSAHQVNDIFLNLVGVQQASQFQSATIRN